MTRNNVAYSIAARRHDIDWLRTLAIVSVVLYHAAQVFSGRAGRISSADASVALDEFCYFFHLWRMPLVFCISGMATHAALQRRNPTRFARDRVRRLLVPLGFGVLVLLPPQLYAQSGVEASFAAFYPRFLDAMLADSVVNWGHLWFVAYLLLADALAVPAVAALTGDAARRAAARFARFVARPSAILALAVPLALVQCVPTRWAGDWTLLGLADFKGFAFLFTLYCYGWALAAAGAWDAITRARRPALGLALGTQAAVYALRALADRGAPGAGHLLVIAGALATWFWVVTIFGYAALYLRFENGVLRYLREASYPVYLVHHAVLVTIAVPLARWSAPLWLRFPLLVVLTFAATFAVYQLVVRPSDAMRFLFGLRPRRPAPAAAEVWLEWRASGRMRRAA